jgi:hypothetical protein
MAPRSLEALAAIVAVSITPLAGIVFLGWAPEAVLVSYFVDTFLGFGTVLVLVMVHVTGDERDRPITGVANWTKAIAGLAIMGAIMLPVVGFPLFFVFGDDGSAWNLFRDRNFLGALAVQAGMSVYASVRLHRELAGRNDDDRVLAGRLFFLAARWIAMFIAMVVGVGSIPGPRIGSFILVAIYAGASIYFELFPEQAMRFVRGKNAKPIVFDGDLEGRNARSAKGSRRPVNSSDTVQPADRGD